MNVTVLSAVPAGESRQVDVFIDTSALDMCTDVYFWRGDYATSLDYWMEPLLCGSTATPFVVTLPGPLDAGDNTLFMSYGTGTTAVHFFIVP